MIPPKLARLHKELSLREVFLSFARYRHPNHRIHGAIAALTASDQLQVRIGAKRWELLDHNGVVVGQLAGSFEAPAGMRCISAKVHAIATWSREQSEQQYRNCLQCDRWEVVLPELVFQPDS